MDFCLTDDQEEISGAIARYLSAECPAERVRAAFADGATHDAALWRELAGLGYLGLVTPEAYGGMGGGLLDAALVCEQMGHHAAPAALEAHFLACMAIARCEDEALKARWLPKLANGEALATVAIGEGGERWEPQAWSLRCEDGRLQGAKRFVPHAPQATLFVVGCAGGELALVEADALPHAPKITAAVDRSRPLWDVDFSGALASRLPGAEGLALFDAASVMLAADAFGAASRLLAMTSAYAMMRQQFGQPIAQFQAVKHQLANMAVAILGTRGLWWFAASAPPGPAGGSRAASLAKGHITDQATDIGRSAVELHGGIGFTWESDVQLFLKRAYHDRQVFGAPHLHRERSARLGGW